MVRPIVKDPIFLAQKSAPAASEDLPVGTDLLDTLAAHSDGCVGMAANMIGVLKRVIVVNVEGKNQLFFNPEILKMTGPYETEEGCLSLSGTRKTRRYQTIRLQYENEAFQKRIKTFSGWTAQIIQHEIDHCNGILI